MIIPRTPSPEPLEERDVTTLSHEELRELQKRARAAKETTRGEAKFRTKRERSDETNLRPRKLHRPAAGDVQLELDEAGAFQAADTASLPRRKPEVIELD